MDWSTDGKLQELMCMVLLRHTLDQTTTACFPSNCISMLCMVRTFCAGEPFAVSETNWFCSLRTIGMLICVLFERSKAQSCYVSPPALSQRCNFQTLSA
ncbi:hypothetical protein DUNSADRAFT_3190 [Dunaliella salina]|uniref:Encoded protein n=1 Tax=Dunaliella salina TaxID=3046 RepID=A0ABQ7GUH8_DUNSA|nr:hypothetical protein DUNSADRAFT_3190 [Dunaliella salina]|eukprot:KAF5838274.1 hypothetical protein DUNSADRAFT_3190 [Dunaliella salina]